MTKAQILKTLNAAEATGACWWTRTSKLWFGGKKAVPTAIVYLRSAHGNDPTPWINGRKIQDHFGARAGEVTIDRLSGNIFVEVKL